MGKIVHAVAVGALVATSATQGTAIADEIGSSTELNVSSVDTGDVSPSASELNTLQALGIATQPEQLVGDEEQVEVLEESPRLIVTYKEGSAKDTALAEEVVQEVTGQVADTAKEEVAGDDTFKVLEVPTPLGTAEQEEVAEALKEADPSIESVEKDAVIVNATASLKGNREPLWGQQWDKHMLGVQRAWDLGVTGAGRVVGVVDTGYINHPDTEPNRLPGADLVSRVDWARDGNGRDTDPRDMGTWSPGRASSWHGTNVASIAVSPVNGQGIAGVAPEGKFSPLRALAYADNGMVSDIADSVYQGAGGKVAGVPQQKAVDVINMSLSYPGACSAYMQGAINYATSKGIPVVVAAGNNGVPAIQNAPGNCWNVITVGATAKVGNGQVIAGYSNYGGAVDIVAPGGASGASLLQAGNLGTATQGANSYIYKNGTSMATPQVAGVLLMMKQVNPNLSAQEYKNLLLNNGDRASGYRALNAEKAVRATLKTVGKESLNNPAPRVPQVNGYKLVGGIGEKYFQNQAKLGVPVTDEYLVRSGGVAQRFSNGYIVYWSAHTGAKIMNLDGEIFKYFQRMDYEYGFGFPVTDQYEVEGGVGQDFRLVDGRMQTLYFNNQAKEVKKVWLAGAIGSHFQATGGVQKYGVPLTDEIVDGNTTYQVFSKGWKLTWGPGIGVRTMVAGGDIDYTIKSKGGHQRFGTPVSNEEQIFRGTGSKLHTRIGSWEYAFVWSEKTGTHHMNGRGAIYYKWLSLGGGDWGYPISDEKWEGGQVVVKFNNGKTIKWTKERGAWV